MFEAFDATLLARLQFAFTVSFHFIFPSLTIGLASYLAVLEGLWLWTGRAVYLDLFKYWLKIFALVFGMGVVSGIVMSYQFGTNWSVFADKAGPIVGPLMESPLVHDSVKARVARMAVHERKLIAGNFSEPTTSGLVGTPVPTTRGRGP